MLQDLWKQIIWIIGAGEVDAALPLWQLVLRTIVIYIVALLLIRVGKRRFMGSYTTFDILLGFIVGSILSRAITGAIRFIDMIFVISALVGLHSLIAVLSFYSQRFSKIVKNTPRKIVVDGEVLDKEMRKSKIGENDLLQAAREKGKVETLDEIKTAYLERDGNITVIPKGSEPKIVEVKVENGVQTVRIVME
ncbi:hypothetical protein BH24ACI2_BH24ACI2_13730 [soil metagenome]|nr:DUF421 domain-containing protein [Acidobacteriota bacterium]